jgi:uncharacterized alkaline shock family protein YloU
MSNEQFGTVKISDDVITAYAASVTLGIDGVHELTGGLTDSISKNILGKESSGKGVKLTRSDEGLILDIYVIVEYKVKIPQLAWEIQGTVKREVEAKTDLSVLEVNIHVQGVNLPGEEDVR